MSLRRIVACVSISLLQHSYMLAQQPAQATPAAIESQSKPALSNEQVDGIIKQYQPIIDKAMALQTSDYLQKAEGFTARYNNKKFLEPILDPEGYRIKNQTKSNNTLRWSCELPLGPVPFGIGVYNGDLLHVGALGSAWGLEWWFYYAMEQALAEGYTDFLVEHATEVCTALQATTPLADPSIHAQSAHSGRAASPVHEQADTETQTLAASKPKAKTGSLQTTLAWPKLGFVIPRPTKKMFALMICYAAGSLTMRWARGRLLLDTTPTAGQEPKAISTLIPPSIASIMTSCCYPQSWTDSINTLFKRFHLLPTWIDRNELVMTRAVVVMLFWLRWHLKNITAPLLEQQLTANAAAITPLLTTLAALTEKAKTQQLTADEQKQFETTQAALRALVQTAVNVSFGTWIYCKTLQVSLWHSITNILLATPAWYKVGCWAYNTYTMTRN